MAAAAPAASASAPPPSPRSHPPPAAADVLSFWFGGPGAFARVASDPLAWPAEGNKRWFFGGKEVDDEIKARFLPLIEALSGVGGGGGGEGAGEEQDSNDGLAAARRWLDDDLEAAEAAEAEASTSTFLPLRALAGIVAMDQFSRNSFRGTPRAFALDAEALRWSRALVSRGLHARLAPAARLFALLPYEHAECLEAQRESVRLFREMLADAERAAAGATEPGADAEAAAAAAAAAAALVTSTRGTLDFAEKHLAVIERWGRFPGRNAALGRESTAEEIEGLATGAIVPW